MKLIFSVLVFLYLSPVQAQITTDIFTSKSEYAYGEPIEISYKISNQSEMYHAYKGTSTYVQHFVEFSGISLFPSYTTLDDYRDTLWPGEALEIIWELDPEKLGLPPISGMQNVSVSVLGICDTVNFVAPTYRGGPMSVYFNEELVDTTIADSILARYRAEILREDFPSYTIKLNGFQIDSLSTAWLEQDLILEVGFEERDNIEFVDWVRTHTETEEPTLAFHLDQNYPNPFNPTTRIPLVLAESGQTNVTVYTATGALVIEIFDGWLPSGRHYFDFRASGLASGTYYYKAIVNEREMIKSMTLIK